MMSATVLQNCTGYTDAADVLNPRGPWLPLSNTCGAPVAEHRDVPLVLRWRLHAHWRLAASAGPQFQRRICVGFIHGAPNWHMCRLTRCAHGRLLNWSSSGNNQRRLQRGFSKPTGICSSMHSLMTETVNCAMALPCSTVLCSLGDNPGRPHRSTSDLTALGMPPPPLRPDGMPTEPIGGRAEGMRTAGAPPKESSLSRRVPSVS